MKNPCYRSFGNRYVVLAACLFVPQMGWAQPPPSVNVVEIHEAEVAQTAELVGSIHPYKRSVIASEIAGLVQELPVEAGVRLDKDQLIGRLRDATQRFALEEAKATLEQLQAELDELEAGTREEEKEQARALMEEAKAVHEKWKLELDRLTRLRDQNSATAKEFHDATWDTAAAKARLDRAEAEYELAEAGPRTEEIARARHAVAAQRAVVDRLKYDLAQMEIKAPFSGYVVSKQTEVGQWLTAGGSVVEMIDLSRVKVRVDVPESFIKAARVGSPVAVHVEALGESFRSEITRVVPDASMTARTFPIEIELANDEQALKSGMFVRARVPSGPKKRSLIVPRDAIILREGAFFVILVAPAAPAEGVMGTPVPVKLGADIGAWVAVNAPRLQPGMKVAVKGHDRIFGPQPVNPIPVEIAPPASADVAETQTASGTRQRAEQDTEDDPAMARSQGRGS